MNNNSIISCTLNHYIKIVYDNKNIIKQTNTIYNLINNTLPIIENDNTIPKILFQTYHDKRKIPDYIFKNINLYASDYKYCLLDDKDAINFLKKYFSINVVNAFINIPTGPHKADLLRYCLLYVYGGIYLDIKILLIKPLNTIFTNNYFYTCKGGIYNKNTIHNAIMASVPRNPIFLKLILYIINFKYELLNYNKIFYLVFCRHLYITILNDLNNSNKIQDTINYGINYGLDNTYFIFKDDCVTSLDNTKYTCSKLDKYGNCCNIINESTNEILFIGRDPAYPW